MQNAVTTLCGTEQLIGSLPEVKWAQQVRSLATELQEESLGVIVQNLPRVIRTQAFQDLRRVSLSVAMLTPSPLLYCVGKHLAEVYMVFRNLLLHSVTEGRVYQRANVAEEALFGHQRRCDCGQLL